MKRKLAAAAMAGAMAVSAMIPAIPAAADDSYTIVMGYIGDSYSGEADIEAALSEKLSDELGMDITLDLRCFSWGTYQQEIQLALTGGEIDIVPIIVNNAAGYVSGGMVEDLTDYIDEYGKNIKECVRESFLASPSIGDTIYGVTTMREQITWEGVILRQDILEEYDGYTVDKKTQIIKEITSMDDLEKLYEKVYADHPDMYMMGSGANSTPLFRYEVHDALTDGFGVLMDKGQNTEVVNFYETDEFKDFCQTMYEWNQAGYISKDGATSTDTMGTQMKAGTIFSYLTPNKAGAVEQDELSTGQDLCFAVLWGEPYTTSYSVNFNTWGIGSGSSNPEVAFQVLDAFYGDSDLMNTLNWGIEGTQYQIADEKAGSIKYADGVDATNTTWRLNIGWELPNQTISYVWDGEDKSKWDLQEQYIEDALPSKALGFSYDSSNVASQITALTNVKNVYYDALGSGNVDDVEKTIKEMNDALYGAGLQSIIDEKQSQLDAWLAKQE